MEGAGEGCGFFCSLNKCYLSTMSQQCSYYTVTQQKEIWQQELYRLTFKLSFQNLSMVYIKAF